MITIALLALSLWGNDGWAENPRSVVSASWTADPFARAPLPAKYRPLPSKQWVTLTNRPGVRAWGRIVNGYVVDIERYEALPQPTPAWVQAAQRAYQTVPRVSFVRGYQPPAYYGACVNGACVR